MSNIIDDVLEQEHYIGSQLLTLQKHQFTALHLVFMNQNLTELVMPVADTLRHENLFGARHVLTLPSQPGVLWFSVTELLKFLFSTLFTRF